MVSFILTTLNGYLKYMTFPCILWIVDARLPSLSGLDVLGRVVYRAYRNYTN